MTDELKISGAKLFERRVHQHQWVAVLETTFLAISHVVTEATHQESAWYVLDSSGKLQTVICHQLGSLIEITHDNPQDDSLEL